MSTICSFCSLLCDYPEFHAQCELRSRELNHLVAKSRESPLRELRPEDHSKSLGGLAVKNPVFDPTIENALKDFAKKHLAVASNLHIGGRIACVETAREALKLAKSRNASIDGASSSVADAVGRSMARSGAYLTTLADVRSAADCIVVVGDDKLLESYPMLPGTLCRENASLSKSSQNTQVQLPVVSSRLNPQLVLLGDFSEKSILKWSEYFPELVSISTPLSKVPHQLREWTILERQCEKLLDAKRRKSKALESSTGAATDDENALSTSPFTIPSTGTAAPDMERMRSAVYLAFVVAPSCLEMDDLDLWMDRFSDWLGEFNEHRRAGMLLLSPVTQTFRSVCTWTTGFPGSVQFGSDCWEFNQTLSSSLPWLESNRNNREAVLIWCDETPSNFKEMDLESFQGATLLLSSKLHEASISEDNRKLRIPVASPGVEVNASMHRSDGTILAHVRATHSSSRYSAAEWLRILQAC